MASLCPYTEPVLVASNLGTVSSSLETSFLGPYGANSIYQFSGTDSGVPIRVHMDGDTCTNLFAMDSDGNNQVRMTAVSSITPNVVATASLVSSTLPTFTSGLQWCNGAQMPGFPANVVLGPTYTGGIQYLCAINSPVAGGAGVPTLIGTPVFIPQVIGPLFLGTSAIVGLQASVAMTVRQLISGGTHGTYVTAYSISGSPPGVFPTPLAGPLFLASGEWWPLGRIDNNRVWMAKDLGSNPGLSQVAVAFFDPSVPTVSLGTPFTLPTPPHDGIWTGGQQPGNATRADFLCVGDVGLDPLMVTLSSPGPGTGMTTVFDGAVHLDCNTANLTGPGLPFPTWRLDAAHLMILSPNLFDNVFAILSFDPTVRGMPAPPLIGPGVFPGSYDYAGVNADSTGGKLILAVRFGSPSNNLQFTGWSFEHVNVTCCPGVITTAPPIRQFPRDDDLALGAPRQRGIGVAQPSSRQSSVRQGFRGTYTRCPRCPCSPGVRT